MRLLWAILVSMTPTGVGALTLTDLSADCSTSVVENRNFIGACLSSFFYIEWTTTDSVQWLGHDGARKEVIERLQKPDSFPPDGMYSGLALLPWDSSYGERAFPLTGHDAGFCQLGAVVPRASDPASGIFRNDNSRVDNSSFWFLHTYGENVDDYSDGQERQVVRCFVSGPNGPSLMVDFFPARSTLRDEHIRLLVDAALFGFHY